MPASDDPTIDKLRQLVAPTSANVDPIAVRVQATALHATTEARQEMDQAHLGLQNLLYEKRHLEREIEKCRQFAYAFPTVPLHSLEEFQQIAPPEARTEDLMLNRLSFELAERQRLDLKRKELVLLKEELLKQSRAKSATVDSVKSQIDALMKASLLWDLRFYDIRNRDHYLLEQGADMELPTYRYNKWGEKVASDVSANVQATRTRIL
ncbi:Fms-interacting protein-domain-containing protein [Pisolithus marmoratus]|nr:Fms-interacting protein-domain-containing protein [Pisolithus marmoratus]